jgi:hypothetical protein
MQVELSDKAYRALMQNEFTLQFANVTTIEKNHEVVYVIELSDRTYLRTKQLMDENETHSDFILRIMGYTEYGSEVAQQ